LSLYEDAFSPKTETFKNHMDPNIKVKMTKKIVTDDSNKQMV